MAKRVAASQVTPSMCASFRMRMAVRHDRNTPEALARARMFAVGGTPFPESTASRINAPISEAKDEQPFVF
jgi:hypothetical protein